MKFKLIILLQCIFTTLTFAQINSAFMNEAQKREYAGRFAINDVAGFIEFRYKSMKDIENEKPNGYTVVYLDSLGNRIKSVDFDSDKKRRGFTIYDYNELNQLTREFTMMEKNSIQIIYEYFYDMQGQLFETVQLDKSGTINSKTINYYNDAGFLVSSKVIGPDGNLTFNRSIKTNRIGLPELIDLTHVQGFKMSTDEISYDAKNLPIEKNMVIGMTGKSSKIEYEFTDKGLLSKCISYEEGEFESIENRIYFTGDFSDYLNKLGLVLGELKVLSDFESKENYTLKYLAEYPGGEEALLKYIDKNVLTNNKPKDKGIVIIGFAIEQDGSITDIKVHRGISKKSDKKAVKIVEGMPNWKPAKYSDGTFYKSTVSVLIPFL
nr:hypothetical protein [uncultured Carboxylicivirga sp.]